MRRGRIEWLDFFRGAAAILVVLYHYRAYIGIPWFDFGYVAVDLFFVLSGIVLGLKYTSSIEDGMTFPQFAVVRLKRLYPMVFIAGAFILTLNAFGLPSGTWAPASDFGVWTVFLLWPYPSHIRVRGGFPANGPIWSLWAELASNVVWFGVIKHARRWMAPLGVATFTGLVFLAWTHGTLDYGAAQGVWNRAESLVRATGWFSVGFYIAAGKFRITASPTLLLLLLVAVMSASALSLQPAWLISVSTGVVGSVLLAALFQSPAPGKATAQIARWLGMSSFPLYLIHAPAGRLLPLLPNVAPPVALLLVMGSSALLVTVLNEAVTKRLHMKRAVRTENVAPISTIDRGPH